MKPGESDQAQRRVAIYFVVMPAVILAPLFFAFWLWRQSSPGGDEFARLMNTGKGYYEQGEAAKAVEAFQKSVSLQPTHPDALLNLANACLLADQSDRAIQFAQQVLSMEANSAAACYIAGCANMRLRKFEEAVKFIQQAKDLDSKVNAVSFQLGRAQMELGHYEDAVREFSEIIHFAPDYPSANFFLGQALLRLGRQEEAKQALERHQQLITGQPNPPADAATFERCVYTQMRVPFRLEQPDRRGVKVVFADATQTAFGIANRNFHGPVGVLDINHRGANDLFVGEGDGGFRVLLNTNGTFQPHGEPIVGKPGVKYTRCLVGDVNNDRYEDVVVLSDQGLRLFKFATNGAASDVTQFARLNDAPAIDGALVDLDFTGKLDLLLVTPGARSIRVLRNLGGNGGSPYFKDITPTSGVPASLTGVSQVVVDDWNNDDVPDLFVARETQSSLLLTKLRGGGLTNRFAIPLGNFLLNGLLLVDYDNDGWLDICAYGGGLRVWRNLGGNAGFQEMTKDLGLDQLVKGTVESIVAADFDNDCDTDLLLSVAGDGLQLLRNDGGNANRQLKLQLIGNRSNASGIGVRIEVTAGHWRTIRTVQSLPIEFGVGKHTQFDSINVHWFDMMLPVTEAKVDQCAPLALLELQFDKTGSCPYLYAWDGQRFRFVTDILSASPAGLRLTDDRFIDADNDEFVRVGDESLFQPRDGNYVLQVTEELREVLYLDAAELLVVDHPVGTEVHTTGKLLPGKPFPPHEIITLHDRHPLKQAVRSDGLEVGVVFQKTLPLSGLSDPALGFLKRMWLAKAAR